MENYPIFPEYEIKQVDSNTISLNSNIYVHKDYEEVVKVYTYLVSNTYIVNSKFQKEMAIKNHLKDAFVKAKYFNSDTYDLSVLPFITTLDKRDEDFADKLHYQYP